MGETSSKERLRIDRLADLAANRRHGKERGPQVAVPDNALDPDAPVFALVILSLENGALSYADTCLLGAAKRLQARHAPEQAVVVLTFGPDPVAGETYQALGADLVVEAGEIVADPLFECRARITLAEIKRLAPAHVFLAQQNGATRALTLNVAAGLDAPVALRVRHLDVETITTQSETAQAGQVLKLTSPRLIELREGSSEPWAGPCRKVRVLPLQDQAAWQPSGASVEDLGMNAGGATELQLDEAEFIVSGGAGITDWALFREMVSALGAAAGASRVAVDTGQAPRATQVGSSGSIVRARCYLALGISGAPQHLEGIEACDLVIAVNTDPNCAMMRRADLAIEADVHEIMRAVLAQLMTGLGDKHVA